MHTGLSSYNSTITHSPSSTVKPLASLPLSFLALSHPSHSIADEQTFSWHPPNPDGPTDPDNEATFYFDVGELVRLRVESEEWHDHAPTGPTQSLKAKERLQQQRESERRSGSRTGGRNGDVGAGLVDLADELDRRAPYIVIVSFVFPFCCDFAIPLRF
jgi:RNA polymerase III subunit Rpc25